MMISTPAKLELAEFQHEAFIKKKIPYARMLDAETIETKSGHLLQVIKIEGLLAETLDDNEVRLEKEIRNTLLKSITDSSIALYFHIIRKKYDDLLNDQHSSPFIQSLADKWKTRLKEKQFYTNELYITIVKKPPTGKIRRFSDLFNALSGKVDKTARAIFRQKIHRDLNKASARIISHLGHYGAKKLGSTVCLNTQNTYSDCLAFLGELINLDYRKTQLPYADLADALPRKRLFFDKISGRLALRHIDNRVTFAGMLSIRDYHKETIAGMLDHLLDVKAEMIITQSFSFIDKVQAKQKIEEQYRNQIQSDDGYNAETDKIQQTLDDLGSSTSSIGSHHFSIICHAESIDVLEKSISQLDTALNEIGIIAIREDAGLKAAFFAALPANQAYIARKAMLSSENIASFASLHNYAMGQRTGNHWGDAITVLETNSGTPFYFNFHVLDVGNAFFIGSMGSGKTLLEAFLLLLSLRLGGRLIVLDKDRGLEIALRAAGGTYSQIKAGERTGFAPFQLPDTPENRYFLTRLMRKIALNDGYVVTDDDLLRIKSAIDGAYQLELKDRVFRNVVAFLGMRISGSLRACFDKWVGDGDYAWVFDNEVDTLTLNNNVIGFDMTNVLVDETVRTPIYFYLFHRIEALLDGTRTRIVVAEGWLALQDAEFQKQIQEWNSTPRKKEAFIVMDTQSPSDIAASPIGGKIIQESPTQIYFANPNAKQEDYVGKFGLTEKEFSIVKNLDKSSRYFLLKQANKSVVVRADLSGMTDEIAILAGRTAHIKQLDLIRKQVGDEPSAWMPHFLRVISSDNEQEMQTC